MGGWKVKWVKIKLQFVYSHKTNITQLLIGIIFEGFVGF